MQAIHLSSLIIVTSQLNNTKLKNDKSNSYDIHFKFRFHRYVLCDEMNKTRSHLHIFKEF
jgi:hypothetical protein